MLAPALPIHAPPMRNIEIKLELRDPELARAILLRLGAHRVGHAHQRDTHFRVVSGRLLRRDCTNKPTEWVRYDRPDRATPRHSDVRIMTDTRARAVLGLIGPPEWLTVDKLREVWFASVVTVCLDNVQGLGWFVELRSLVTSDNDDASAAAAVAAFRHELLPALGEPVSASYRDMLELGQACAGPVVQAPPR